MQTGSKFPRSLFPVMILLGLISLTVLPGPASAGDPVDINTATAEELLRLPGVGPVLAQRIVTDREANGPFKSPEEITRVFGFGDKKYQTLKDLIITVPVAPGFSRLSAKPGINLNTATQAELESLPGIGPTKALRIIEYREKEGGFRRTEELMEVWGIGPRTYESLKNLVTVQGNLSTRSSSAGTVASAGSPRTLKCWRCGEKITVGASVTSGECPACGAKWKAK